MKAVTIVLFLAVYAIECRKIVPINKNANIDFINMEGGGGARPPTRPVQTAPAPAKPQTPEPPKTPTAPAPQPKPVAAVTTSKPVPVPVAVTPAPPTPAKPTQPKPAQPALPSQADLEWKPLPTKPASGVSTPGYGSVKQLVTFYDSQGKASVIRPYSYSDAVKKQG